VFRPPIGLSVVTLTSQCSKLDFHSVLPASKMAVDKLNRDIDKLSLSFYKEENKAKASWKSALLL
jgi:hypothetical protein